MSADAFEHTEPGIQQPGRHAANITPNDSRDLANIPRGIYVGGAGDLDVTMLGEGEVGSGGRVTFVGLLAGSIIPIRVSRVWAAGTTATNLRGIW